MSPLTAIQTVCTGKPFLRNTVSKLLCLYFPPLQRRYIPSYGIRCQSIGKLPEDIWTELHKRFLHALMVLPLLVVCLQWTFCGGALSQEYSKGLFLAMAFRKSNLKMKKMKKWKRQFQKSGRMGGYIWSRVNRQWMTDSYLQANFTGGKLSD